MLFAIVNSKIDKLPSCPPTIKGISMLRREFEGLKQKLSGHSLQS